MIRPRSMLILLALGAVAACDRRDAVTAPIAPRVPHALPTVNVVNVSNTSDDGAGSLRKAIADAQPGDVIHFADAIAGQKVTLTSGQLLVDKALTIEGSATKGMTISGGGNSRVITVTAAGDLTIRNLTVSDAVQIGGAGFGGGIVNDGKLTVENSTISNNFIDVPGTGASAGGIANGYTGTLKLVNSTVSGNRAPGSGGIASFGGLTLIHTTIAGNVSLGGGTTASGGFDAYEGSLLIRNSIVGGNQSLVGSNDACHVGSASVVVLGKSIVDRASCITDAGVFQPAPGSLLVLGLQDNGGPTKTHAVPVGSVALDAALADCPVAEDQRHVARPQGLGCEPGAYEFSDYIRPKLAVDQSVAVNPSTGVAIVTGTLSCPTPIQQIPVVVDLSQEQKSGRATATAKASGTILLSCVGAKAWSISLVPQTGAFISGAGSVAAKTLNPSAFFVQATTTAAVKLYWAKR